MMTVTQLAREARVSIRTVRFYEEKGIVGAAARTAGGRSAMTKPHYSRWRKRGFSRKLE